MIVFPTKAIQDLRKSQVKSDKDILWVRSQGGEARTITVVLLLTLPQENITIAADSDFRWFPVESLPQVGLIMS
jgi:hypothetical protein